MELEVFVISYFCCVPRKPIVPQKEPSPLLNKKIEELEAKFADMDDADEELDDLDDEEDEEAPATPSMPQMHSSIASDIDMPYTPPQVSISFSLLPQHNAPLMHYNLV